MRLADLTWTEAGSAMRGAAAFWPIGAVEAHGPHLPLGTDILIAEEMVRRAVAMLRQAGRPAFALPAMAVTPARYAGAFAGTLSLSEGTAAAVLCDVARSLDGHGVEKLVLASAHVDPANLKAIEAACEAIGRGLKLRAIFPNLTRKPWVLRLPEEFKRGGAHAGQFETSLVMASAPGLVKEDVRRSLARVEVDLGERIRSGARTFEECGGDQAYFGDPASATPELGHQWYEILSGILTEAAS